ncbi:MAG: Ig-like domain-containing protein [Pseudomonadota bacterium]
MECPEHTHTGQVGLLAHYFALTAPPNRLRDIDFEASPTASGIATAIDQAGGSPFWQDGPEDNFAVRYSGDLNVVNGGRYRFDLGSDDGSVLLIDGIEVVSNDGLHATTTLSGMVELAPGPHAIEVRYFERGGEQVIRLDWQGPDTDGVPALLSGPALSHGGPIDAGQPGPCPETGGAVCHCHTEDAATSGDAAADALAALAGDAHSGHHGLSGNHAEHLAALDLVTPEDVTHIAVADGDWFAPVTWAGGAVPGDSARVLIADGVTVDYGRESDARIATVAVDGALRLAPDASSRLIVDTLVVAPGGRLEAGSGERPVDPNVQIDLVIANNGAIDTGWDAQLLSRGLVSLGEVEMHGAEKVTHLKVATDPRAGDTMLSLAEPPTGWQVGDTIVLAGTDFSGWGWDNGLRTSVYRGDTHEMRTITAIDGATVTLNAPLTYDHTSPREDLKTSVANQTRSITIRSEDGEASAVHERGHVMFMGSDDVDVRYVAFDALGRTDKSERSVPASSLDQVVFDSNVQGRYSIHLHQLGTEDVVNPAILAGNAVTGSPGWGIAHHSSNANLHANTVVGAFGSAFVAERGDEIGTWSDNLSIGTEGLNRLEKDAADVAAFDLARTGSGYWFQGRMVESIDNIAAGARTGFVWMARGSDEDFDPGLFDQPEALGLGDLAPPNHPVINTFRGNETFGSERGLVVIKANPAQHHDLRTVMEDFTAWEVRTGAHFEYTAHYTLKDFDLVGAEQLAPFTSVGTGIEVTTNTSDIVVLDAQVDNFEHAYELSGAFTFPATVDQNQFVVVGGELSRISGSVFEGDEVSSGRVEVLASAEARPLAVDAAVSTIGYAVPERSAIITGSKTDSLGTVPLPAGTDDYRLDYVDVRTILETDGYFLRNGMHVFVAEAYYQDRLTGEIVKEGHLVEGVNTDIFANQFGLFRDAVFNGVIPEENRAPVATGEAVETAIETPLTFDALSNDTDPDGHAIRIDGMVQPAHGKVFDLGDGQLRYAPDLEFSGTDGFSYWVTDGYGAFTRADVSVTVQGTATPANQAPDGGDLTLQAVAAPQVIQAASLLAASEDPDGDQLSILAVSAAVGGTADLLETGDVRFAPASGAAGAGAGGFTLRIGDGQGGEATARITLDLPEAPVPLPPIAVGDTATVDEDGPGVLIDALANDEPGSAAASITQIAGADVEAGGTVTLASGARVTLTEDGSLTYDPSGAFEPLGQGETATDRFDYRLASLAGADTGTVTVRIEGVDEPNRAPIAGGLTLAAISGAQVFDGEALLAASLDPDGDPLSVLGVTDASGGVASLTPQGDVAFSPEAGQFGAAAAAFTIRVGDGRGGEDMARITLDLPEARGPVAEDDALRTAEDAPAEFDPLGNDDLGDLPAAIEAVDGQPVQPGEAVALASGASVALTAEGRLLYDPNAAFDGLGAGQTGADAFSYTLGGAAGQDTATVAVMVDGVGSLPVPPEAIGAAGRLSFSQPDRDSWLRVDFGTELDDPSVVVGPPSFNGSQALTIRVRNVTETGFELQMDEWGYLNGRHLTETVGWLAVSAGTHRLGDGRVISAGSTESGTGLTNETFDAGFASAPIVLGQVTSVRDPETVALRLDAVTASGFAHRLQEAEAEDGKHLDEELAWIAVEAGAGALDAGHVTGGVDHRRRDVEFDGFDEAPALLAAMQTTEGGNPATLRLRDPWSAEGAGLFVQEEQSRDRETWHVREDVGYVALEPGLLFGETG